MPFFKRKTDPYQEVISRHKEKVERWKTEEQAHPLSRERKEERLEHYSFNDLDEEYYVYIVECQDKTLYTGMTNNLLERTLDHKTGNGSRYTQEHKFKRLAYFERQPDKKTAELREREIKDKNVRYRWLLIRRFNRCLGLMGE